nr:MAG: replication associated protein [Cressdnaviricota sp.]
MVFQLKAKSLLLTYAQCSISKELLLEHLRILLREKYPDVAICVGHELHQDTGDHLHCFLHSPDPLRSKNERWFDYEGYHPNVVACRAPKKGYEYCKKDGDFIESGSFEFAAEKRKWSEIESATTKEEAVEIIKSVSYRDFVLQNDRIEQFLSKKFRPKESTYEARNYWNPAQYPELDQWVLQIDVTDRPKSLILVGASRLGKTEWARSVGHHMYFNGSFNLDKWDPDAAYAIFDDWEDWSRFFQYKQWLGAQREFEATDKYRAKRTLIWGKPSIILSNEMPCFKDWNWIQENCFIQEIKEKLF